MHLGSFYCAVEVLLVSCPVSRKPRGFAFVEYVKVQDAERCLESLHQTVFDGSTLQLVFVEPKEQPDRRGGNSQEEEAYRPRGPREPTLSHLAQPSTVAPAPPMNPNTETYRYNSMAGEFVIDSSGRLTRRRGEFGLLERARSRSRSPMLGLGGGLLKAVRPDGEPLRDEFPAEADINSEAPIEIKFSSLRPSQVVDFRDI